MTLCPVWLGSRTMLGQNCCFIKAEILTMPGFSAIWWWWQALKIRDRITFDAIYQCGVLSSRKSIILDSQSKLRGSIPNLLPWRSDAHISEHVCYSFFSPYPDIGLCQSLEGWTSSNISCSYGPTSLDEVTPQFQCSNFLSSCYCTGSRLAWPGFEVQVYWIPSSTCCSLVAISVSSFVARRTFVSRSKHLISFGKMGLGLISGFQVNHFLDFSSSFCSRLSIRLNNSTCGNPSGTSV